MPKAEPWNSETAREAGRKGGRVRAERERQRRQDPIEYARSQAGDLLRDLQQAAKGEGDFANLPIDKRLDALKTYLGYALGKPATRKDKPDEDDEKEEEQPAVTIE